MAQQNVFPSSVGPAPPHSIPNVHGVPTQPHAMVHGTWMLLDMLKNDEAIKKFVLQNIQKANVGVQAIPDGPSFEERLITLTDEIRDLKAREFLWFEEKTALELRVHTLTAELEIERARSETVRSYSTYSGLTTSPVPTSPAMTEIIPAEPLRTSASVDSELLCITDDSFGILPEPTLVHDEHANTLTGAFADAIPFAPQEDAGITFTNAAGAPLEVEDLAVLPESNPIPCNSIANSPSANSQIVWGSETSSSESPDSSPSPASVPHVRTRGSWESSSTLVDGSTSAFVEKDGEADDVHMSSPHPTYGSDVDLDTEMSSRASSPRDDNGYPIPRIPFSPESRVVRRTVTPVKSPTQAEMKTVFVDNRTPEPSDDESEGQ